jgi:hypothetical protein
LNVCSEVVEFVWSTDGQPFIMNRLYQTTKRL